MPPKPKAMKDRFRGGSKSG